MQGRLHKGKQRAARRRIADIPYRFPSRRTGRNAQGKRTQPHPATQAPPETFAVAGAPYGFGGLRVQLVAQDKGAYIGNHMLVVRAYPGSAARQRILTYGQPLRRIEPLRPVDKEVLVAFRRPEGSPFGKKIAFTALVKGGDGTQEPGLPGGFDVETGLFAGLQNGGKRREGGCVMAGRGRARPCRGVVHG